MSMAESGGNGTGDERPVNAEGSLVWEVKIRLIGNRVIVRDALVLLSSVPGLFFSSLASPMDSLKDSLRC